MDEHETTSPRKFSRLPTYDTSLWRAAIVYAKALLGATESEGKTETVMAEFDSLVNDVLDQLPDLNEVFKSGFVETETKVAMLERAFAGKASPLFLNFLKVLAEHGRFELLRMVHLALEEELNKARHRVRVLLSTATELDPEEEIRIAAEIRQRLHLEPVIEKQIHPELIGGIVLRIGDRVFDGSIATQLANLREKMVTRSVHEIQSRRDRFSSAS